ncbi:hypothetical protein NUW54_g533 [Trametes sanguinea]|uniref:Uncharacterized protein n=1 Tax=Trametes sanguinea TaxID=158606 RepID=A0ACC1QBD0_9APHY|nr:hypothetical protein NUW54_g533 [Trametes sanguinea]
MNEFKYYDIPSPFPTLARGLFTQDIKDASGDIKHRIVARGYDKFFNIGEVPWTNWASLESHTAPPYTLTLKSNGCIIFIAALTPTKLLVTSKHSLGPSPAATGESHAQVGERWLRTHLAASGKTEEELARTLWEKNWTAGRRALRPPLRVLPIVISPAVSFDHTIPHHRAIPSFVAQPGFVLEEVRDVLRLLTDIGTLVFSLLVNVLKFFQGLDHVEVVPEVDHDVLGSGVQQIVEHSQGLRRILVGNGGVQPKQSTGRTLKTCRQFFPLVVQPLVQHLHDLHEAVPARR